MKLNTIFTAIGIIAVLGMVGMTFSYAQTALADKGGVPDDSALSGKACDNANERNNKHHDKPGWDSQGHQSSNHNGKGVEWTYC